MINLLNILGKLAGGAVLLLILAGIVLYALAPHPPKPPTSVNSVAELDAYLNALVESGDPPGLSLAVVKNGVLVYSRAFGLADGPNRVPATPDTVYRWWSMTKIPTAIAILRLHEQGDLDIDDPVTDYVSFFQVEYPSATSETVTIRHLLNHSSGMPDATADLLRWTHPEGEPHPNQTALIEHALPDYAKLTFEPGTQGTYTNVGYMVLGAVIEAVSGQTYEDYVVEHILQPLGMEQTGFVYTDEMRPHEAAGSHPVVHFMTPMLPMFIEDYNELVRETVDGRMWFNHVYPDQTSPTGLIGPVTDVARLMLAYLNDGELDGQCILSAESVAMMTNESHVTGKGPQTTLYPGMSHGLGWWVIPDGDQTALQHTGGGPGFATLMRLYPDQSLGIVVLANGTNLPSDTIADLAVSLTC